MRSLDLEYIHFITENFNIVSVKRMLDFKKVISAVINFELL